MTELQGIDISMVLYDVIVYASRETGVDRYATIEVAARARIRAQIVLSNVVHDKNPIVREQCLFAAYGTYLTSK